MRQKQLVLSIYAIAVTAAVPSCGFIGDLFDTDSSPQVIDGMQVCDGRPADIRAAVLSTSCPGGNDEQCPTGAYCDSGECVFDCAEDLLCSNGSYCDCRGRCALGPENDAGMGSLDYCRVDFAKVEAILSPPLECTPENADAVCTLGGGCNDTGTCQRRRCAWDDDCPLGAYCDHSSGYCGADCLDPASPCAEGYECDCKGKCSQTDSSPSLPARRALDIRIEPSSLNVRVASYFDNMLVAAGGCAL